MGHLGLALQHADTPHADVAVGFRPLMFAVPYTTLHVQLTCRKARCLTCSNDGSTYSAGKGTPPFWTPVPVECQDCSFGQIVEVTI